jgi:hypothetical protein
MRRLVATVWLVMAAVGAAASDGVTVPMLDFGGRPLVEVKINGAPRTFPKASSRPRGFRATS